jgi:arsenate reductase-like glutaredoxin family protein
VYSISTLLPSPTKTHRLHKALSALAAFGVALSLSAVPASASPLTNWYTQTGLPTTTALTKASHEFKTAPTAALHLMESTATNALAVPPPRSANGTFAFRWASSMTYYQVGASLALQALKDNSSAEMNTAATDIGDGNTQMGLATKAMP